MNPLADKKNAFLTYKGKPLVRQGNTLYYGNMYDPFVVMLTITKSEKKGDLDIAEKVRVQLMNTDPTFPRRRSSSRQRNGPASTRPWPSAPPGWRKPSKTPSKKKKKTSGNCLRSFFVYLFFSAHGHNDVRH